MKKILKSIKYLILIIDILWLLLFTIDCIRFTQKDVKPLITIKESYEIKYEMGKHYYTNFEYAGLGYSMRYGENPYYREMKLLYRFVIFYHHYA